MPSKMPSGAIGPDLAEFGKKRRAVGSRPPFVEKLFTRIGFGQFAIISIAFA
jgi:hypothetical protein